MSDESASPQGIWQQTVRKSKDIINHRSFWEALEKSVAITLEDDTMVIGMPPSASNLASFLTVSDHKNAIDRTLAEITGRPVRMRLIHGHTVGDWANTKERDQRVQEMQKTVYKRKDREAAEAQSWDALYELAARNYTNTRMRQLPQGKARYLNEMLSELIEAMTELYPEEPDEFTERQLARVIDRVANSADLSSTVVAIELNRLWQARKPAS
jgi:hypothetical protein